MAAVAGAEWVMTLLIKIFYYTNGNMPLGLKETSAGWC